jgi:hypothetical protein
MKFLVTVTLALVMSITALSQTQHRITTSAQTKRELISLGRQAVLDGVGTANVVVDDRFTGNTAAVVETKNGELLDPKVTITGTRALVKGRVVFKGGLHVTDQSTPVTIRFMKRDGQWRFAGLCIGNCRE